MNMVFTMIFLWREADTFYCAINRAKNETVALWQQGYYPRGFNEATRD